MGGWISDTSLHVLQVLKFYNLEGQSKWMNLLYESCFLVLFLILAWCGTTTLTSLQPGWSNPRGIRPCLHSHGDDQSTHHSPMICTPAGMRSGDSFMCMQGCIGIQAPHQQMNRMQRSMVKSAGLQEQCCRRMLFLEQRRQLQSQ